MITRLLMLSALSLAFSTTPATADEPVTKPTPAPLTALPPPGMDDAGVTTSAAADTADSAETVQPAMPDTRLVREKSSRDAQRVEAIRASSEVTRRQEGNDTVEEYRESGSLRMIRIIPQHGPEQIYMDSNRDGRLDRDPRDGPVSPVYFTLYEWN